MKLFWWLISQEARVALANYQWNHHKERLDAIHDKPPEKLAEYSVDMEPEVDPELVRDMQKRSPGYRAT